jgi:PAS domain S-box-containing protein
VALMPLRWALARAAHADMPFIVYYPLVVAMTLWGGAGPGLVAAVLTAMVALFEPQFGAPALRQDLNMVRQISLFGTDVIVVWLCAKLRDAQGRAARHARNAEELLDRSTDCFLSLDSRWRLTYINPQMQWTYGITRQSALGRSFWDVFPQVVGTDVEWLLRGAVAQGKPVEVETRSTVRPDLWIELRAYPSASGLSLYERDVTDRKRAADVLKAGDELLRMIADMAPVFIGYVDSDFRYRFTNHKYAEWFGIPVEQINGRRMSEIFAPAAWEAMRPHLAAAMAGTATDFEREILDPQGNLRWVKSTYMPDKGPDGRVRGVVTVVADETERRRAEREVETSEQRYRNFIQSSSEAIWRCESSYPLPIHLPVQVQVESIFSHTYLAECNEAMARMYGFESAEAFVGAKLPDFLPPADPYNVAFVRKFVEAGYRLTEVESHQVDRNGEPKFFINSLVGVVENGRLARAWGTQRDVTVQKQVEASLRDSEERLRLALDAGQCGAWDWDVRHDRVTWSARIYQLHGLHPDEFGGTVADVRRLVHPEDRPRLNAALQAALYEGAPYQIEFRTVRPDGQVRWLATRARVEFDVEGRPLRMFGVVIDVTERKAAEEEREHLLASERAARGEAENANRMKDEFLATVSHELRTPLNAILGWAQLLRMARARGPGELEDLPHGLETIERNAKVQARIIDDLLDMSRVISGKLRLNVQPVDLPVVIGAAIESVRSAADAKGIVLKKRIELPETRINGDSARLQQIVWNLLSNAIKFTQRGGSVGVTLRGAVEMTADAAAMPSHSVEIEIADTGEGIRPDFLPHVFDRFRQADATAARRHNGLGLGLAIVKHLVEQHGGTVRAASEGEGRGAAFTVSLPVAAPDAGGDGALLPPPAAAAPLDTAAQSLRGVRVLVVDDEPDARELVRRILEESEAHVATAGSAMEGLEMLGTFGPDVLVSDIGMPIHDGYEFIRRVRATASPRHRKIPAAALTAFARAEDHRRALIAGYQVHVSKPVEPAALVETVAQLAVQRDEREPARPA